jgi:tetratricopeptide (TPR) repeat protein
MDTPSAEAAYAFTHALLQRACYELMLPSERAELHRRALDYLHTHNLASPEELAGHALAGQVGAPGPIADNLKIQRLQFLRLAADSALDNYANERGLSLLDAIEACDGLSEIDRVQLRLRRADVLNRVGQMDAAIAEAEAALSQAQSIGNEREIARAQLTLGRCSMDTASNARAPGLLQPAVDTFRRLGDETMLELAVSALSRSYFVAGKPLEALPFAQQAVALAEKLANENRAIRGKLHVMTVLAQLSRNDEAIELSKHLTPLLDSSPNPEIRCALAAALASLSHGLQEFEEASGYHERARKEAAAAGLQAEIARAEVNLGGIDHQLRRFSSALHHIELAESMARELGNMRILWFALRNRHEVFDTVGDYRSALHAATSAARLAESAGMAWHYLVSCAQTAACFLELGQVDDALECVDGALKAPRGGQFLNFVLAKLYAERACAQFRLQIPAQAAESLAQMEHFLQLAGSEPDADSQRWIQEARSHVAV